MDGPWDGYKIPAVSNAELADLDWKRLGEYLLQRRQRLGMTQADVANAAGVAVSTVQNFERARVPKVLPNRLTAVVVALGWDPGSGMAIASGGEPIIHSDKKGDENNLVFVMTHAAKAGPWTLRAMRAVLQADLDRREDED